METIIPTTFSLLITATQVLANGNNGLGEGLGLTATFFIVLGILVVFCQLLPGLMLFGGMVKGLFTSVDKKTS